MSEAMMTGIAMMTTVLPHFPLELVKGEQNGVHGTTDRIGYTGGAPMSL
jgi:hypothetical protein